MTPENLSVVEIQKVYKDNYRKIIGEFMNIQSEFLSGIYNRYDKDLDAANIVLFFAKNLHQETLRLRDSDLNVDISFENFWNNHSKIRQKNFKIINIAKETGLPKETTRRKINNLIRSKMIEKQKNYLSWKPVEKHKESYNEIVSEELKQISKLIQVICIHLNITFSREKITNELKKYYSFYWYHYLNTQLQYLKMWQNRLSDLELLLISMQCLIQSNLNSDKGIKDNIKLGSVSATSISDVTGIPRATCIRKLDKLYKMKIIKKDQETKRYYFDNKKIYNSNVLRPDEIAENTIEIFSNFFLIILKALLR
jgi:DNA-binding Lrp family transcriptional regulator